MLKNNEIKLLVEKKNSKLMRLDEMSKKAMEETRAFSDEERAEFEKVEEEIRALSDTIEKVRENYKKELEEMPEEKRAEAESEERDIKAFESFIRNAKEEQRADGKWEVSENGAVIPQRIANRIIEEIKERCRIYEYATKFNVGGTLSFPVYDESEGGITMSYAEEFSELTATNGKFKSISLGGFLAAALTKVSISLINNSQFELYPYVIGKVGEAIAAWLEKELLTGTESKIEGLGKVEAKITKLDADGLIDLQDSIPQALQAECRFIMNPKTKNKIRKFKDGQGNYLLERDYAAGDGGWKLLGKSVELTDTMKDDDILYGDFSGLYVKIAENPSIQVLREHYATEHAVGIVAWLEVDAKVAEPQKIARLTVAGE